MKNKRSFSLRNSINNLKKKNKTKKKIGAGKRNPFYRYLDVLPKEEQERIRKEQEIIRKEQEIIRKEQEIIRKEKFNNLKKIIKEKIINGIDFFDYNSQHYQKNKFLRSLYKQAIAELKAEAELIVSTGSEAETAEEKQQVSQAKTELKAIAELEAKANLRAKTRKVSRATAEAKTEQVSRATAEAKTEQVSRATAEKKQQQVSRATTQQGSRATTVEEAKTQPVSRATTVAEEKQPVSRATTVAEEKKATAEAKTKSHIPEKLMNYSDYFDS